MWKQSAPVYSHILLSKDQEISLVFFWKIHYSFSKNLTQAWNILNKAYHCNAYKENLVYKEKKIKNKVDHYKKKISFNINKIQTSALF